MSLVFAGGGTGGHLFPALAIMEAAGEDALFLCSDRPLDAQILTREGVRFRPIKARPISSKPVAMAKLVLGWGGAVRTARRAIREMEAPIVVAMGGYVAAPVVQAARAERVPVLLVNLDAVPGKANRWVARRATRVVTAAPVERFDWERIPPIVRASAVGDDMRASRGAFGLDPDTNTLLVCGGSQGARSINLFMAAFVDHHTDLFADWQVIHQCGEKDEADVRFAYEASSVRAVVRPFIDPMGPAWGAATLAVSRAGAGSVAEAWANHVPTIFMPYPHHRDQHQRKNAEALGEGCVIVRDRIVPQGNLGGEAGERLKALMSDEGGRGRMRSALERLGPTDGAARVASALKEMRSAC